MKKKLLSIVMASVLITSLSITAHAAPPSWDDSTEQEDNTLNTDITGDTPHDDTAPVYGYVGENAVIIDPDPTDPDVGPEIEPSGTEINVTVPIKMLWAAFAGDGGAVSSPSYYIRNNSAAVSLKVTLTDFAARATAFNTAVDGSLILNLTGTQMAYPNIFNAGTGVTGNTTAYAAVLTNSAGATHTWNFAIGGTYTGSFAVQRLPEYDMSLKFSLY